MESAWSAPQKKKKQQPRTQGTEHVDSLVLYAFIFTPCLLNGIRSSAFLDVLRHKGSFKRGIVLADFLGHTADQSVCHSDS